MIVYFADRQFNILGQASTELPKGLVVVDDNKTTEIETGVAVFECKITYDDPIHAKSLTAPGNYILRSNGKESELFTITDREIDTKKQEIYLYAEDDGLDLLNEVVGIYEADQAYPIDHYITKYAASAGFEIGINEAEGLVKQLTWDSETTASARIASIAAQFDGCEISYSFEVSGLNIVKKFINVYRERGEDHGIQLRFNNEIDNIVTTESITNLATALQVTGGTPDDSEEPTTLIGYQYDDGDFFVDGAVLKSRTAFEKWRRFILGSQEGGHITKPFSHSTTSQAVLCEKAIEELKRVREMELNYEIDIKELPDNVKLGDRISIVDDAGELYVSARVLKLEESVVNQEYRATLGEYLIKGSGIHQKVAELAEQFAQNAVSAQRALEAAQKAKENADQAKSQVDAAVKSVAEAQRALEEVADVVDEAKASAAAAQEAANNAQSIVNIVEDKIESLETTITNAQEAANNAHAAAQTADQKAEEAKAAASNAAKEAAEAKANAETAAESSGSAITVANEAVSTANDAKTAASAASATAAAAKADAEQAKKDVDALGDDLETVSQTMEADYTRKTEFTETTANLQSQIEQNAAQISSTVSKVTEIDETANNAAEQAATAQSTAAAAQTKADQATADAQAAQTAANNAAAAASAAQNEADTAKAAAEAAQSVANKAEQDLAAAQADLETVTSRVDATEEEILAAQKAVEAAQTKANEAKQDAQEAAEKAAEAQSAANAAVTDAANAQTAANNAASQAALAQQTANEAKGNAEAAQNAANEAAATAAEAQRTADTAVANAATAQAQANAAAQAATDAQNAADAADAKAAQAATDLAAAQQNLANVTSKVDATAEEVAAAQAAVEAAKAAADKAQEEAEAAQATADTAKENADTAQAKANEAKTAAENAQAAAEEAQAAADKAQEDVNDLAVRVTTAETKITQNSEAIELRATKTEVTETLGGYYTKEQADAAIQVKADEITSSVSSVQESADANAERVEAAESTIRQLADTIAMLITDENGASLMTQTADGWTFNMSQISDKLDNASTDIEELSESLGGVDNTLQTLEQAVKDLGVLTNYVIFTNYNGQPCIELGQGGNDFKLRITNTEIQFVDGTAIPAYVSNKKLMIEQAEVKDELQFGDDERTDGVWVWSQRSNGNLGLVWKGR